MNQVNKEPKDFVSFYNEHKIMPVGQDVLDEDFQSRRRYLYRNLGIPLNLLGGAKVLEFGPGGGYNATVLAKKSPMARYWCVEGAMVGVELIQSKFSRGLINTNEFKIMQMDFLSFESDETFDLVIAELCIPGQQDPKATLKHISQFVSHGGYLVITTTSQSSLLSEILRAVYAKVIRNVFQDEKAYEQFIHGVIGNHLKSLSTKTRSVKDWVDDNLKQNWFSRVADFNVINAVSILDEFEFMHSSPRFLTDLSWYKSYHSKDLRVKSLLKQQWPHLNLALLDYRVNPQDIVDLSRSSLGKADLLISKIYNSAKTFLIDEDGLSKTLDIEIQIQNLLESNIIRDLPTFWALLDFKDFLLCDDKIMHKLSDFGNWWGRGTQYLSFYKI